MTSGLRALTKEKKMDTIILTEGSNMQDKVSKDSIDFILKKLKFKFSVIEGTTATVCLAFYHDFSIGYGMSDCVDPANFDKDLGEKYAKERALADAENKAWELEGWALRFHGYKDPLSALLDPRTRGQKEYMAFLSRFDSKE